jgi:chorismate synthase
MGEMNSFGRRFKVEIFGESHGLETGVIIDGALPGIDLSKEDFMKDLKRRQSGAAGTTGRVESDIPLIKSGLFNGKTTGSPILISFLNKDVRSKDYTTLRYLPRPGHADLTAYHKYCGFNDFRGGGHFSGRITLGLVAGGVVAKKILNGVEFITEIISLGKDAEGLDMKEIISKTMKTGDSVGGVVECRIKKAGTGLGEPFFDSVESVISHLMFSIPGVRGVEFGAGFKAAYMSGKEHNDEILNVEGKTQTNNQGGINGGITNGNEIVFRVAFKPTSSISIPQKTIDMRTGKPAVIKIAGRHDTCFVLRTPVIVESAAAIALADLELIGY